jgi:hypothetical protein
MTEENPQDVAYDAADRMLAMVGEREHGRVIRAELEKAFNQPAKRRDLYDLIHAQDETNFRILMALTALATGDEGTIQHQLQVVVDGIRIQGEITKRISKGLLQLADTDAS